MTSIQFFIIAPFFIFIAIYLFQTYYKTKNGRLVIDKLILKIPLFGSLILRSEVASFCDTLCTLVDSGIPIVEGLQRCIMASENQVIKNTIISGIIDVEKGKELSTSLGRSEALPKLCIAMILK